MAGVEFRLWSPWPFPWSHTEFSPRVFIFRPSCPSTVLSLLHWIKLFTVFQMCSDFFSSNSSLFLLNSYLVQSFLLACLWPSLGHWFPCIHFTWWSKWDANFTTFKIHPGKVQNSTPKVHSQPWRWAFSTSISVFWGGGLRTLREEVPL